MPKERIRTADQHGWTDLLVQWGPNELGPTGEGRVRLFPIARDGGMWGGTMFHPEDSEAARAAGFEPGSAVGPVEILLTRDGCNQLIRKLRRARDQVFGRDE